MACGCNSHWCFFCLPKFLTIFNPQRVSYPHNFNPQRLYIVCLTFSSLSTTQKSHHHWLVSVAKSPEPRRPESPTPRGAPQCPCAKSVSWEHPDPSEGGRSVGLGAVIFFVFFLFWGGFSGFSWFLGIFKKEIHLVSSCTCIYLHFLIHDDIWLKKVRG